MTENLQGLCSGHFVALSEVKLRIINQDTHANEISCQYLLKCRYVFVPEVSKTLSPVRQTAAASAYATHSTISS